MIALDVRVRVSQRSPAGLGWPLVAEPPVSTLRPKASVRNRDLSVIFIPSRNDDSRVATGEPTPVDDYVTFLSGLQQGKTNRDSP